jgi:translation elongation factor P
MISSNDLRPGVTIEYRDGVWQVIEAMHVKPGKGSAFVQTKLRNVESGDVLSVNFRAGERLSAANVEKIKLVFIYRDSDQYVLMDTSGVESVELEARHFGRNLDLLKEGLEDISVMRHRGKIIRVELPNTVDLEVRETPPNERGNTTSGSGKQATLETGAVIMVPFHVKSGDKIQVDTRTREYVTRLSG